MGQTKRFRKKYSTPMHPWQKERIIEEKDIVKSYGLKNKKEVWKYNARLSSARNQVKKIIADTKSDQALKEKKQLVDKLVKYGVINKDSNFADILDLKAKDFLERRLQTIVYRKGLSRSVKQARQFIIHGHVTVSGKKVTAPSYFVSKEEESKIGFLPKSTLSKNDHPERIILEKKTKKEIAEEEPKEITDIGAKQEAPEQPKEAAKEKVKEVSTEKVENPVEVEK